MAPVNKLLKDFPVNGTDELKAAARKELSEARTKALSEAEDYVLSRTNKLIESDGTGKGNDLVPDKGFYNALEYKWTRADNNVVVYRLQAPAAAGGNPTWTVYDKIKANGEVGP